jgi:COP9 signalosome complex subunit 6
MSVSISLHPLAVLNISDHLTRAKYQMGKDTNYRVIGVLLGKQHGRSLDVVNTVEISFGMDKGKELRDRIDERFCQERLEAYKKIFPDLECIGWYSA